MIKINFCDMYKDFNKSDNIVTSILNKEFGGYELSDTPDFLFYATFGTEHLKFDKCVKIFMSGEAIAPNFNECDYAIGYDRIIFGDRYFRRPVWLEEEMPVSRNISLEAALNRRFCNFIYSNDKYGIGSSLRKEFAKKLMQYKRVDCPGKVLNNMTNAIEDRYGDWRRDKINFIGQYKFTIAFENSSLEGYTTEKMTQPLAAGSIPIYWGSPDVTLDFNEKAFVYANGYEKRLDELVEKIVKLDQDNEAYMQMIKEPLMSAGYHGNSKADLEQFLIHIIRKGNQPYCKDPMNFAKRMSVDNLSRKDKIKYFLLKK